MVKENYVVSSLLTTLFAVLHYCIASFLGKNLFVFFVVKRGSLLTSASISRFTYADTMISMQDCVTEIIQQAKQKGIPLVIDGVLLDFICGINQIQTKLSTDRFGYSGSDFDSVIS